MTALAGALAFVLAAHAAGPTPTPATEAAKVESGNGTMGQYTGLGGDPALGQDLYAKRCASCHDAPAEGSRAPAKALIAANTPTFIMSALAEGVMAPMARGMSPHEMASVAAYLSTRKNGGLGAGALEAPACTDKPAPMNLAAASQWNGWGRTNDQTRFQPNPGVAAADVPKLKLKWAFAYAGSRNGQATVIGDVATKQRFCESLLAKYGGPDTGRPKGFFPRLNLINVYAIAIERITGKEQILPPLSEQWPAVDRTKTPLARP